MYIVAVDGMGRVALVEVVIKTDVIIAAVVQNQQWYTGLHVNLDWRKQPNTIFPHLNGHAALARLPQPLRVFQNSNALHTAVYRIPSMAPTF